MSTEAAVEAPVSTPETVPVVVASATDLKIIDWDEAMVQVGGDREFLNEVLQDLLAESRTAEEEIGEAIKISDFSGVMKAAHRIKGSASYLCCEALRDISLKLQDAGHDGTTSPKDPEQLLAQINVLFEHFVECLKALRSEIEEKSE
jgi:HPt (histidine-containing phosphotransfer) domain-containing protein